MAQVVRDLTYRGPPAAPPPISRKRKKGGPLPSVFKSNWPGIETSPEKYASVLIAQAVLEERTVLRAARNTKPTAVPPSSGASGGGGGSQEWQPKWNWDFGSTAGPLSAAYNLLANAELLTPVGRRFKPDPKYKGDGSVIPKQQPPQACHFDNVYDMDGAALEYGKRTFHSKRSRGWPVEPAAHRTPQLRLVKDDDCPPWDEPIGDAKPDTSAFTGEIPRGAPANDEGTEVPDSTTSGGEFQTWSESDLNKLWAWMRDSAKSFHQRDHMRLDWRNPPVTDAEQQLWMMEYSFHMKQLQQRASFEAGAWLKEWPEPDTTSFYYDSSGLLHETVDEEQIDHFSEEHIADTFLNRFVMDVSIEMARVGAYKLSPTMVAVLKHDKETVRVIITKPHVKFLVMEMRDVDFLHDLDAFMSHVKTEQIDFDNWRLDTTATDCFFCWFLKDQAKIVSFKRYEKQKDQPTDRQKRFDAVQEQRYNRHWKRLENLGSSPISLALNASYLYNHELCEVLAGLEKVDYRGDDARYHKWLLENSGVSMDEYNIYGEYFPADASEPRDMTLEIFNEYRKTVFIKSTTVKKTLVRRAVEGMMNWLNKPLVALTPEQEQANLKIKLDALKHELKERKARREVDDNLAKAISAEAQAIGSLDSDKKIQVPDSFADAIAEHLDKSTPTLIPDNLEYEIVGEIIKSQPPKREADDPPAIQVVHPDYLFSSSFRKEIDMLRKVQATKA